MDKTILVEPDIDAGRELIAALDESGFDVRSALWFYVPEAEKWRFIIASPMVEKEGPIETYGRIQSVLKQSPAHARLSLQDITIVGPDDGLLVLLRSVLKTGPGIFARRFTRGAIDGVYIEDAYVYRLQ